MRKVGFLALGASLALVACSTILGDFSVGDGGTSDGGNDVQTSDVASDGPAPDVVVDSGPDVQPVKLANCKLDPNKMTSFTFNGSSPVDDGDHITILSIPNKNRVSIEHYNSIYYADFNDNDSTALLQTFTFSGQIISSTHVQGPTAGMVFLVWDQSTTSVSIVKWPDTPGSPPVVGITLVPSGLIGGTPANNAPFKGTIAPLDFAADDYLFALEYTFDGQNFKLAVGHAKAGPTDASSFKTIDSTGGPDMASQSIAHDQSSMFLWLQPGGNNQGPQGPAPLYTIDIGTLTLTSKTRQLQPASGLYAPFAFTSGAPGTTDMAFVEGDLNNQNAVPFVHTQAIPSSTLATFDPKNVLGASVPFSALTFNKGQAHWTPFPGEDEWIGVGRPLQDGTPGVNILWFDSKGNARAIISETDGGGNFPSTPVGSVDMTFQGQPTLVVSSIRVAWVEGQTNTTNPKVFSAGGTCTSF